MPKLLMQVTKIAEVIKRVYSKFRLNNSIQI
jgi:hypothetical protein